MRNLDIKNFLHFFKKRPDNLVAYIAFLVFIVIIYWMSGDKFILAGGIGFAAGLFARLYG